VGAKKMRRYERLIVEERTRGHILLYVESSSKNKKDPAKVIRRKAESSALSVLLLSEMEG
jgi:hypothetical protein